MKILGIAIFVLCEFYTTFAQPVEKHPKNPHYLLYHGQPRILITLAENSGAVLYLDFGYNKYLNTLHDEGMDYTRIFTGAYLQNAQSFGIEKKYICTT